MTAIIILNWNGEKDTIACLASLFRLERQDFIWLVADNASAQASIDSITEYLHRERKPFVFLKEGDSLKHEPKPGEGIIYSLNENYGFAKSNNMGIELLERFYTEFEMRQNAPAQYLLLNNDTEQNPDFLRILEDFAVSHPQYSAMTPQIRYGMPSERIWNCGGKLRWGFRRYCYGEKNIRRLEKKRFYR